MIDIKVDIKRVAIFIGLKFIEIVGLIVAGYLMWFLGIITIGVPEMGMAENCLAIFVGFIEFFALFFISIGIILLIKWWIKSNWKYAGRLSRQKNE